MLDIIPTFMAKHGADQGCVDAWKTVGAELASVFFAPLKEHWDSVVRPNKQAIGNELFTK